jgi:hypothetical protein
MITNQHIDRLEPYLFPLISYKFYSLIYTQLHTNKYSAIFYNLTFAIPGLIHCRVRRHFLLYAFRFTITRIGPWPPLRVS